MDKYHLFDQLWTQQTHYGVGKYLTNLPNLLTQNEYIVKDSFEAVNMIH